MVDISNKSAPQSTTIMDVRNDVILATCSSLTTPGQLYVARLPPQGEEQDIAWVQITLPCNVPAAVANATVEYLHLEHENSEDSVKSFTAMYMAPKVSDDTKLPLIVWPHGGPHAQFVNGFANEAALFTMLGFASVLVNYRGSTGAGDATVHFLPKHVGDADVKDCQLTTDTCIQKYPIDEKKIGLTGGSHGGFLVTHLSGQYPDVYAACVTRNPVIDVVAMFNSTDIPDWCAVEAGFQYKETGPVSDEEMLAMRRCSPIAHIHKVKTPTALMLGSGDKRVPMFQGLEYARRLKAAGVETRVYMYDDNHSLSSQSHEMDWLINGASWLVQHLQPSTLAIQRFCSPTSEETAE
ncbi:prolyl oligopeptidase family domain-containing protein [Phthorimaea operculella]|nr:prolyl oligopeptidase family domain-containing protein [Phthorimaea operculella]